MSDFGSGPFTGQPQMMPIAPPKDSHPHPSGSASHGSWISPEPHSDGPHRRRTVLAAGIAAIVVLILVLLAIFLL